MFAEQCLLVFIATVPINVSHPTPWEEKVKEIKRNWMVSRLGEGTLLSLCFCTEYKSRTSGSCNSKVKIYKAISFLMFSITAWEATHDRNTKRGKLLYRYQLFYLLITLVGTQKKQNILRAVFLPAWIMKQCYCSPNRPTIVQEKQPCWFFNGEAWKMWFEKYPLRSICDCDKLDFSGLKNLFPLETWGISLVK